MVTTINSLEPYRSPILSASIIFGFGAAISLIAMVYTPHILSILMFIAYITIWLINSAYNYYINYSIVYNAVNIVREEVKTEKLLTAKMHAACNSPRNNFNEYLADILSAMPYSDAPIKYSDEEVNNIRDKLSLLNELYMIITNGQSIESVSFAVQEIINTLQNIPQEDILNRHEQMQNLFDQIRGYKRYITNIDIKEMIQFIDLIQSNQWYEKLSTPIVFESEVVNKLYEELMPLCKLLQCEINGTPITSIILQGKISSIKQLIIDINNSNMSKYISKLSKIDNLFKRHNLKSSNILPLYKLLNSDLSNQDIGDLKCNI